MILFVDRLPFYVVRPEPSGPEFLNVTVPVVPTDPVLSATGPPVPPQSDRPFRWKIDTACTTEGFVWRSHLLEAGLSPDRQIVGRAVVNSAFDERLELPLRRLNLWLVSNIPYLQQHPFRVRIDNGLHVFRTRRPTTPLALPIIGMRALDRAGVKVVTDFSTRTVSVWVSSPWPRTIAHAARRLFAFPRTTPIRWANE